MNVIEFKESLKDMSLDNLKMIKSDLDHEIDARENTKGYYVGIVTLYDRHDRDDLYLLLGSMPRSQAQRGVDYYTRDHFDENDVVTTDVLGPMSAKEYSKWCKLNWLEASRRAMQNAGLTDDDIYAEINSKIDALGLGRHSFIINKIIW